MTGRKFSALVAITASCCPPALYAQFTDPRTYTVAPVGMLPGEEILSLLLVLVFCYLVGLAIRTSPGQSIRRRIERSVFDKIPGYAATSAKFVRHALRTRLVTGRVSGLQKRLSRNGNSMSRKVNFLAWFTS
jgi:hypothetical protein